jgi:endothelin-converting enzyme/putative endopeptidase
MPDRDYYVRPEPRFNEARDKYLAHVAKMFELAGSSAPSAATGATFQKAFSCKAGAPMVRAPADGCEVW